MRPPRRKSCVWPPNWRVRIAVAPHFMRQPGFTKKVLAIMIHLSLAIHCAESSLATPIFSILTGTAAEAAPDNPGRVLVTLSKDYQPPQGYDVRHTVSKEPNGDPSSATPIAPGETVLSAAVSPGTAYVNLYLVRSSDGMVAQQTQLPVVTVLGSSDVIDSSAKPVLTEATAFASGATAARGSVTTDEGSGTLYWVATQSDAAPAASDILTGRGQQGIAAANSGSVPIEVEGPIDVMVLDLVSEETYYLHFAQVDSAGTLSEVSSTAAITPVATVIEDLTNPVVENIFDADPLRMAWQGVTVDDYTTNNGTAITGVTVDYEVNGAVAANGAVTGEAGDTLTVAVTVTASDRTETRFVYGPATVSATPVIDITPPILSDFTLSASGPDGLKGSVSTSEVGGSLHWIGVDASMSSTESDLHAAVEAGGSSSIGLSGTIPVSEAGIVPVGFTGLVPEKDYVFYCCHADAAGNRSNVVKSSARTLPAGNLTVTIEDFSRDKVPFHSKRVESAPVTTVVPSLTKDRVLGLADDPSVGSQHQGTYKVPGRDALPAGLSVSGNRIDVSRSFTGWLEGWDLTGYMLSWRSGEVRIRNSILGERDGPVGLNAYIDIYPDATLVEIANNDLLGPNAYGGAGVAIKYRTAGSGASATGPRLAPGRVARNRFFGLSSDAIKPTGGLLEENVILYQNNLDGPARAWSSTQSYAKGQLARNGSDNVFRSKSNGNRGNPVPSRKSDTTHWESLDPHCDAINPATVIEPLLIQANHIDMDADPNRSVGMNNAIRSVPNSGSMDPHQQVDVVNNVLLGATGGNSKLIQATDNGNRHHVPDKFYNNWVRARSQGDILHTQQAAGTVWENNRDIDTDEVIPGTPDTIADSSLAKTATATPSAPAPAYLARVARRGTATPGHKIEARAVPEGGAAPTEWTEIAMSDGKGHWSGALDVPRGPNPYRFEVRLKDAPYTSAKTTRTFVSGVLIAMHTQSDIASPALKDRTPWVTIKPERLLKDDQVQMFYLDGFDMDAPEQPEKNLRRVFLSNETPYSPGMAAMANTFIDLLPDTPVALIMHTVSGTSPVEMASDGNGGRDWDNDEKLHNFVVRDGNQPGLHANYFSSSYKGISNRFGEALAPIFTGRKLNGTPFKTPGRHGYGYSQSLWIDHTYTDLYDLDFTQTMILPIDAIEEDDSLYDFVDTFPGLFQIGKFDLYNSSVNGRYNESKKQMDDTNHANSHKEWGGPRRMRMWALSMIEALGEQPIDQPLLDIVEAAPNGDAGMVRIGSTSGPVSTLRKQLDQPELNSSKYPAYGDVFGIYVNGSYVDAYIGDDKGNPASEGWIYVPRPRGAFTSSDIIGTRSLGFARDHVSKPASGAPSSVDYYLDDAVLSKPVVPSGIHRVWGLHAIMPREAGDAFRYSDITAGKWAGEVPDLPEKETPDDLSDGQTDLEIEDVTEGDTEAENDDGSTQGGASQTAEYVADFSADLSKSPLVTASSDSILRHKPDAAWSFSENGRLSGSLELTGTSFSNTHFTFKPDIRLDANQRFELDLAAYASSLDGQNSAMGISLYCDHDGGSDLLSHLYPTTGTTPGTVIADTKGESFVCNGSNGRPRIEFFIDNPRNDKRRISLMKVVVRPT